MNYFLSGQYYVYLYLREDGTPYYVGKGKNYRVFDKRRRTPMPTDLSRMIILHCASEQEAFYKEVELISQFGRQDKGSGILRNFSDGGEGTSGRIMSDAQKLKHRSTVLGKPHPLVRVMPCSEETKQKLRERALLQMKNKPHSAEVIEKCRQAALQQWSSGKGHSYDTKADGRQ